MRRLKPTPAAQPERRSGATLKSAEGLNLRQQRFVAEYLIDLNATQAAVRAGYSVRTAKSIGQENLTKPAILAAVLMGAKALIDRPLSAAERVIAEAKAIAYSDVRKLYKPSGELLSGKDVPAEVAPAIRFIREVRRSLGRGGTEVVREVHFWDKNAALNLLAKYHKLLTDKVEVQASHHFPDVRTLSNPALEAAENALLAKLIRERAAFARQVLATTEPADQES
jgi:phage terminase small subunit